MMGVLVFVRVCMSISHQRDDAALERCSSGADSVSCVRSIARAVVWVQRSG